MSLDFELWGDQMNFLDTVQNIIIITIVVFVVITLVLRSKKKQIIFSSDKKPPDIFQFDRFSLKEEKFDFALNYEIYVVEGNGKELIGYFEEKTNFFLGLFNFFYYFQSIIGFSMELKDLSGRVIQKYKQSFGIFSTNFKVYDQTNNLLMVYKSQSKRPKELKAAGLQLITIHNLSGKRIGYMTADPWARRYKVYDETERFLCQIDKPFKNLPWSKEELVNVAKDSLLHDDKFLLTYQKGLEDLSKKIAFPAMLYVAVNYHQQAGD